MTLEPDSVTLETARKLLGGEEPYSEATVRTQVETRLRAALDAWDAAHAAADAATLERFARVQAARDGSGAFRVKYERTLALGDALSGLLGAWERYQAEGAACERQYDWCDAAEREIAAALNA